MPLEFSDELLSAYLDGELSPAERALVESQLAADPEVRQLLDELRTLSGEVRELPRYAAGSGFSQRVVQAALAAKAEQNGAVAPAAQVTLPSSSNWVHSDKARRGARLPVVLAGVAAVAATVTLMVWAFNRTGELPLPRPGQGTIAVVPVDPVVPVPALSPAAEAALARLRQALPQEGEALVLRVRLGSAGKSPAEALDAAFAAAGLGTREAGDDTTGAFSVATAYQNKLAEKIAGQADATLAAADAVFVTCPLDMLEKAVASLGSQPQSPLELSPLMSGRVVLEADGVGESASAGPPKAKHFAQRLAAGQFRLDKSGAPLAELTPLPVGAALDPTRAIRVLILVEP